MKKEKTEAQIRKDMLEIDIIMEEVMHDPEAAEEAQREYGTLTPEELRRQFTIWKMAKELTEEEKRKHSHLMLIDNELSDLRKLIGDNARLISLYPDDFALKQTLRVLKSREENILSEINSKMQDKSFWEKLWG